MNHPLPRWQYITQGETKEEHLRAGLRALEAGCPWVQIRMKTQPTDECMQVARTLARESRKRGSLLTINDRVGVAWAAQSDGVHLGQEDMPPAEARMVLGSEMLIGGTANTWPQAWGLLQQGVDYIGLGPFRFTRTKAKLSPVLGLQGYRDFLRNMRQREVEVPVFAIGGIGLEDIAPLRAEGVYGIAVSGLLHQSGDMAKTVADIENALG